MLSQTDKQIYHKPSYSSNWKINIKKIIDTSNFISNITTCWSEWVGNEKKSGG